MEFKKTGLTLPVFNIMAKNIPTWDNGNKKSTGSGVLSPFA